MRDCIDKYNTVEILYMRRIMLRVYEQTYNSATMSYELQSTGEKLRQAFISNRDRVGVTFGTLSRTPVTRFGGEFAVFYNGPDGRAAVNIEEAIWVGE